MAWEIRARAQPRCSRATKDTLKPHPNIFPTWPLQRTSVYLSRFLLFPGDYLQFNTHHFLGLSPLITSVYLNVFIHCPGENEPPLNPQSFPFQPIPDYLFWNKKLSFSTLEITSFLTTKVYPPAHY